MSYEDLILDVYGTCEKVEVSLSEEHFVEDAPKMLQRCSELYERDIDILFRRYGLNGYEKQTLKVIGNVYSRSKDRIRGVQARYLRMLKHPFRRGWLVEGKRYNCIIKENEEKRKKNHEQQKRKSIEEAKKNKENISDLELSVRTQNCLKNDNIKTVGELAQKTRFDLLKIPNFGRRGLLEIESILLSEFNISLKE